MAAHVIQFVEPGQLILVSPKPLPRLAQQSFSGLDCRLEADIGISTIVKRDIALECVQRDSGVFPPGRVCQLEGLATPAELV